MLSNLSVHDLRVVNFVLTSFAVLVTCVRLGDRIRTARLWWDDAWAAFTALLLITFMATNELHFQDPAKHSVHLRLIIAYMCPHFFYAVTWSARVSILLTIIRISLGTTRKLLVWTGIAFVVTWAILFSQVWWVCEDNPKWKESPNPQCPLGLSVAIAQVISDVLSDAILILAPLRLVWKTRLSGAQKIRVIVIFSTTLITTAISLNHAYFVLRWGGIQEGLAAILQCNVSLIVANLSVVMAFFYRINTEDDATVPTFTMGATTKSFFSWQKRVAMPVTSTFMTADGVVRERKDVHRGSDTFAIGSGISKCKKDEEAERRSTDQSVSDMV